MKISSSIEIKVFGADDPLTGVIQVLHPIKELKEFDDFKVFDERDHTFFVQSDSDAITCRWKNKAGEIQFCGSGAFALCWYLLKVSKRSELKLNVLNQSLNASIKNDVVILTTQKASSSKVKTKLPYSTFFNLESGIYMVEVSNTQVLQDPIEKDLILKTLEKESEGNIHGLCIFNLLDFYGELRYFSPWHGRSEDYVTGSIHKYLAPVINEYYGRERVFWKQLSSSPGELESWVRGDQVLISGIAEFQV